MSKLVSKNALTYKDGRIFDGSEEVYFDGDVWGQLQEFEKNYQVGKVIDYNENLVVPKIKKFEFESEHEAAIKLEAPKTPEYDKAMKADKKITKEMDQLHKYDKENKVLNKFIALTRFICDDKVVVHDMPQAVNHGFCAAPNRVLDLKYTGDPTELDEVKFLEMLPYVTKGYGVKETHVVKCKKLYVNEADGDSLFANA